MFGSSSSISSNNGDHSSSSPSGNNMSTTPPGSPAKAAAAAAQAAVSSSTPAAATGADSPAEPGNGEKRGSLNNGQKGDDSPADSKKRRSSGMGTKAAALFANAKQSLHLSHSQGGAPTHDAGQDSALKKLGKTDPALSVPQGANNNSAGNSQPGPHSTFRVGVTEDRNKKCRRTMEDTHAYLYNFLSTPAPLLKREAAEASSAPMDGETSSPGSISPSPSAPVNASQVMETDNGYFAIFDGHAGTFAADWCGKKLHILLEEAIRMNPNSAIPELLDQTFTSVDQQLQKLPLKNSGCTAITAVLRWEDRIPNPQSATGSTAMAPIAAAVAKASESPENSGNLSIPASIAALPSNINSQTAIPKLQETATRQRVLYTANVGDARIVLCRNGKALRLSYDHKGSDENEGRRITNAGGMILNNRVNGVLAVTRALGDAYMKELVTGHPYTTETVIQADIDEFLILACDGLWDVCSDQEAVELVRNVQDPQVASKMLVDHALTRFSTDNLSCMVIRFDNTRLRQVTEKQTEPIGVDGDAASKRGTLSEADAIVKEARHSLAMSDGLPPPEEAKRLADNIIREEVEKEEAAKERGPELVAPPDKGADATMQT